MRHDRRRALEHYGLRLDDNAEKEIKGLVEEQVTNGTTLLNTIKGANGTFQVEFNGSPMVVVYDMVSRCIVTYLPRNVLVRKGRRHNGIADAFAAMKDREAGRSRMLRT